MLVENSKSSKFTIAPDWVQVFGTIEHCTYKRFSANCFYTPSGNLILEKRSHGVEIYDSSYMVYRDGEHVADLYKDVNTDSVDENACGLKLSNHLLYTDYWMQELRWLMDELKITYRNLTRFDIAIDGVNNVVPFLNKYMKAMPEEKEIFKMGRAQPNVHEFDDKTMLATKFSFGSAKSDRVVAIYNKIEELKRSNKKYIYDFWKKSGTYKHGDHYRIELRQKSKFLKKIKDFDFNAIDDPYYQLQLFRTGITNFFDFKQSVGGDTNKSRMEPIELFDWDAMQVTKLAKADMPERSHIYKVKLAIKVMMIDILQDKVNNDFVTIYWRSINSWLDRYDLHKWFEEKRTQWEVQFITTGKIANEFTPEELVESFGTVNQADEINEIVKLAGGWDKVDFF